MSITVKSITGGIAAAALVALLTACAPSEEGALGESESRATDTPTEAAAEVTPAAEEPTEAAEPESEDDTSLVTLDAQTWQNEDGYWNYYALIENPSDDAVYVFEDFTVELLDAEDVILDSDSNYPTILPGTEVALAGRFFDSQSLDPAEVDRIEVRGPLEPTTYTEEVGSMTLSEPEFVDGEYSATVRGTLTSDFVEDQETVSITIVAFNTDGKAVAQDFTYVDRLPAGGTTRYEVDMYDVTSTDGLTVKVWAHL